MHTTMVPKQVKTQKTQAGVQVSRQEDTNVIFSIGSTMEDFILFVIVLVIGRLSYARALIEVRVDVELKDNIMVFGHVHAECPKYTDLYVVKNMKKPGQALRGVLVGPKVGFKPVKQVFRQVSKKNNVNTSGNKKKDAVVEPTIEVSNSNPFDVLNSVKNDVDLGTNGGTSNLASNKPNFGGSLSWNVEASSTNTTPIVDKIDNEDEVESVDNDMARFMASERVGFGTNSLLEQWRDTYENYDYDYDPYDDDMYEGQEILDNIKSICDNLDITIRGRKKK
ncbi:hypothetical protein Tco_0339774 [Tanacetum coccineum]